MPIFCFLEHSLRLMDSESELKRHLSGISTAVDVPTARQVPAKSFPLMETTPTQSSANVGVSFCQNRGWRILIRTS